MKYTSTRNSGTETVSFDQAVSLGLAPDGGLYVPVAFPTLDVSSEDLAKASQETTLAPFAKLALKPFVKGSAIAKEFDSICEAAFDFPVPLKAIAQHPGLSVLELFHGPTAAFKDVGARFLAQTLARLSKLEGRRRTILVATSGDTGGAVASAFADQNEVSVLILYPKGKISARQEHQLTAMGSRVRALATTGSFDDCQALVKAALADEDLVKTHGLASANSISVGRLLPQMAYHAKASLQMMAKHGKPATFVIPTGNLGNATAALWAKKAGFPIKHVVLATNANRTLPDYFETGRNTARPTISTLANAMDVSAPSNFERLLNLYSEAHGSSLTELKTEVSALSVPDDEIKKAIQNGPQQYHEIWCPHTAAGVVAFEKTGSKIPTVIAATAHPAKFETIVEPLVGHSVPVPASLAEILKRPSVRHEFEPNLANLSAELDRFLA